MDEEDASSDYMLLYFLHQPKSAALQDGEKDD